MCSPAVARAVSKWISDVRIDAPRIGDIDYNEYLAKQFEEEEDRKFEEKQQANWWEE